MNIRIALVALSALGLAVSALGCGAAESADEVATAEEALFSGPAFYDNGTQCTVGGRTMHCCPIVNGSRSVMVGARLDQNRFKCRPIGDRNFIDTSFVDTGTQRNGMHACPTGSIMRGLHVDQNLLICIFPPHQIQPAQEFVDFGTQDGVGHVCGSNNTNFEFAMGGIHASLNRFTCDTDTLPN